MSDAERQAKAVENVRHILADWRECPPFTFPQRASACECGTQFTPGDRSCGSDARVIVSAVMAALTGG